MKIVTNPLVNGNLSLLQALFVEDLVMIFSQGVWEYLHQVFGGGPACTSLFECVTCKEEQQAILRRQKSEYETFIALHTKFQEEEQPPTIVFAISMRWFRLWEAFVRGRQQEPPGPLDNSCICANNKHGGPKPGSDYAPISKELWEFFHNIYGGGPEIFIRYGYQDQLQPSSGNEENPDTQDQQDKEEEISQRVSDTVAYVENEDRKAFNSNRNIRGDHYLLSRLKSLSDDNLPYSVSLSGRTLRSSVQRTSSASQVGIVVTNQRSCIYSIEAEMHYRYIFKTVLGLSDWKPNLLD